MLHHLVMGTQIALAWLFAVNCVLTLVVLACRRSIRRVASQALSPMVSFAWRLLPAAVSLAVVCGVAVPAYVWLEPRGVDEPLGCVLRLLACGGALILLASAARGARAVRRNSVALRALRAGARRLDGVTGPVPAFAVRAPAIVFLAGVFRPKLYVSESILEVLTGEELEAVVAHELAHHHAHDNAKRRVLAFVPDLFARTTLARGLEERWRLAAELSADAAASGCSRRAALALASALVKVARLKAGLMPSECDCAALDSGRAIADRVHRLVSPPRTLEPAANGFLRAAPVGVVLLLLAGVPWLSDLLVLAHEISELVVHLP